MPFGCGDAGLRTLRSNIVSFFDKVSQVDLVHDAPDAGWSQNTLELSCDKKPIAKLRGNGVSTTAW